MKTKLACALALALSLSIPPALAKDQAAMQMDRMDKTAAMKIVDGWPETPKMVAGKMIEKYGAPNEATASMLIWHDNAPWKRTIVYREEVEHDFPAPHTDLLEQFVDYQVPPGKFDDLAQYDSSVIAERTKGEISARCDKEEANFLALNLAHDIVTGKRDVQGARKFYADTVKAMMDGRMSPYLQKLQFSPRQATADADKPADGKMAMQGDAPSRKPMADKR